MCEDMDKREVRHLVARRKKEYSEAQFEQMSRKITARLQALPRFQEADTVFAYMDIAGEVRMREFIRNCWEAGKKVGVPKIIPDPSGKRPGASGKMRFYRIDSFDELQEGMMHIPEPDMERCECLDQEEKALVIMPGVAFDTDRRRIGYGGGFYDRYLALHPQHPTIAVAYEFQVFDRIPSDDLDIRPEMVVTEDRMM